MLTKIKSNGRGLNKYTELEEIYVTDDLNEVGSVISIKGEYRFFPYNTYDTRAVMMTNDGRVIDTDYRNLKLQEGLLIKNKEVSTNEAVEAQYIVNIEGVSKKLLRFPIQRFGLPDELRLHQGDKFIPVDTEGLFIYLTQGCKESLTVRDCIVDGLGTAIISEQGYKFRLNDCVPLTFYNFDSRTKGDKVIYKEVEWEIINIMVDRIIGKVFYELKNDTNDVHIVHDKLVRNKPNISKS